MEPQLAAFGTSILASFFIPDGCGLGLGKSTWLDLRQVINCWFYFGFYVGHEPGLLSEGPVQRCKTTHILYLSRSTDTCVKKRFW